MIAFFTVFIIILIFIIAFIIFKLAKEEQNFSDEEDFQEEKIEKKKSTKTIQNFTSKSFEENLKEASNDPEKMDILKRQIQDDLRKAVREKNVEAARNYNLQLKQIDAIEEKGIEK